MFQLTVRTLSRLAAMSAVLLVTAPSLAGDPGSSEKVFTPEHVARLRAVSEVAISPDGRHVAYVLRVPRELVEESSGPAWSELHVILPNGLSRPYVAGEVNVGRVAWTPDGAGISFLAKRGKDEFASLYVIPVDGGEARRVLAHESDIRDYSWSPEGGEVAFIASDPTSEERKKLAEKGFNQQIYEEDYRPVRVFVARPKDENDSPRALDLPGAPTEMHWAPRGRHIALALAPTPLIDDYYMSRKLHVVDADSGKIVARFDNPGKLGPVAWSPDAEHVAFISALDRNDPSAGRLMVAPAAGGEMRQLASDFEGDFDAIAWKDAETILYLASQGLTSSVGEIHRDGTAQREIACAGQVVLADVSLSSGGETAAMRLHSPRHPSEVCLLSEGNSLPRRMTDSNPWLGDMRFAPQEVVEFKARDGLRLEGILIRPLDEKRGQRYPLILSVHGGPEAHEQNGWLTSYVDPGQVGAARGFAIFYPNYRGSTGRGVAFSKMGQADYAGREFDDLVDAVDHLVASGLADRNRVGVTGGSYGGYASAWCATRHSERFAASVMFVGISDLISKSGTTDIPREMFLVHARRSLLDSWQWYLERSPIYHVRKARTPILILHGAEDPRVHPSQSLELYRQIKELGNTPVRLVFYPGEGHGNRRSAARYDYHLRMLRWFEHYLKGAGGEPPPHGLDYGLEEEKEDGEQPTS